jgi:hypothetical protein
MSTAPGYVTLTEVFTFSNSAGAAKFCDVLKSQAPSPIVHTQQVSLRVIECCCRCDVTLTAGNVIPYFTEIAMTADSLQKLLEESNFLGAEWSAVCGCEPSCSAVAEGLAFSFACGTSVKSMLMTLLKLDESFSTGIYAVEAIKRHRGSLGIDVQMRSGLRKGGMHC